jgi:hypothetical protein
VRDRGVVFGGAFEGRDCELSPQRDRYAVTGKGREILFVLRWMRQYVDVFEVFRGGAQKRDTADVDLLDRLFLRYAGARDGRFEGVEVDGHGDDLGNAVRLRRRAVLAVAPIVEYSAENLWMQRFDAAAEERGETGQILHVARGDAALLQERARSTGSVDLNTALV